MSRYDEIKEGSKEIFNKYFRYFRNGGIAVTVIGMGAGVTMSILLPTGPVILIPTAIASVACGGAMTAIGAVLGKAHASEYEEAKKLKNESQDEKENLTKIAEVQLEQQNNREEKPSTLPENMKETLNELNKVGTEISDYKNEMQNEFEERLSTEEPNSIDKNQEKLDETTPKAFSPQEEEELRKLRNMRMNMNPPENQNNDNSRQR